jgi:hypothetical protein
MQKSVSEFLLNNIDNYVIKKQIKECVIFSAKEPLGVLKIDNLTSISTEIFFLDIKTENLLATQSIDVDVNAPDCMDYYKEQAHNDLYEYVKLIFFS